MAEIRTLGQLSTEQVDVRSAALDQLDPMEFVLLMNQFDREVVFAVETAAPAIARAIAESRSRLRSGGRMIYLGAGTSGRLGVLDASECPPTFGVPPELIQGIIAGGDMALRHAVEGAEDDAGAAAQTLADLDLSGRDVVVAISASGYAPYCRGALSYARSVGALCIALSCNEGALISQDADIAVEIPTGPEILSGSTRLKAGTATKMALNMLSTGVMVGLGKTYGNLMVDMRASNAKLRDRALRILCQATGLGAGEAQTLLNAAQGEIKAAIVMALAGVSLDKARHCLKTGEGFVSRAVKIAEIG